MADSSKPNEMADDLDLEDGEIESDNEEAEVIVVEDKVVASQNNVPIPTKNPFAQNPKNDATLSPLHKATRDGVKEKNDG